MALADIEKCEPVVWYDEKLGVFDEKHFDQLVPLYTSPISKEWVGLSDAEIHNIYNNLDVFTDYVDFARAIEAKLKELNHEH